MRRSYLVSIYLIIFTCFFLLPAIGSSVLADVNITELNISPTGLIQANTPVTVTANATNSGGQTIYYKFYYCANYGTSDYATSPWVVVQDYSTNNSAQYSFPSAGDYIVVARAVTDPNNEPAALPIIGQVVSVASSNVVNITKLSTNAISSPETNETITITAEASSSNGAPVYYKFYYCSNYGTADYATSPWVVVQDYSTSNSAQYSFPNAGNYIVVVRAVTDPNNEPAALPIIGGAISVVEPLDSPPAGGDYTNSLGMTFILIPSGTFMMGSPTDEPGHSIFLNETQHQVTLTQSFYIQTTEVTQGQWEAVMGNNPSFDYGVGDNYPVYYVSWYDVQDFIEELNAQGEGVYRLPTEAEWEYSARAGSITAFANGDITFYSNMLECNYDTNLDAMGWYCYNTSDMPHPVAEKSANAWGLYDMHGNVGEWCSDWYGNYPSGSVTDPTGSSSGSYRVGRGGNYFSHAYSCRSAARFGHDPNIGYCDFGVRLVRTP